jgi:hypothetical protein
MRSNKFIKVAAESSKCPKTDAGTRAANLPSETGYALENAGAQAGDRFIALSALFDAGTIRHLEGCGVSSGWHCLEVGGGGGSIAAWLSQRVGSRGRVCSVYIPILTESGVAVSKSKPAAAISRDRFSKLKNSSRGIIPSVAIIKRLMSS